MLAMNTRGAISQPYLESYRQKAIRLEYFTIVWNSLEALVGILAGAFAGSIALVGFGLDSVIETISGVTLLWRLRKHGQGEAEAELTALRIVGATFFALAAYVTYQATSDLWRHHSSEESIVGIFLAAVSLIVMPLLGHAKRGTARQLGSAALAADGMETYLCSYLSFTLLLGLGLNAWQGWWWADPVAALAMVPFMIREGVPAVRGTEH